MRQHFSDVRRAVAAVIRRGGPAIECLGIPATHRPERPLWSGQGQPASIGASRSQKTCSRRVDRRNNSHQSSEQVFSARERSMPARYLQTQLPSLPKHRHKRLILRRGGTTVPLKFTPSVIRAARKASDFGEDGQ